MREVGDKTFNQKCIIIKVSKDHAVSFQDMHYYYACRDLGKRLAAMKRVPYDYNSCDDMVRIS